MELVFTPEQEHLRTTVRRFLEHRSPESEVRRVMATRDGYDPAVWSQMSDQLGLTGLIIPERFGGAGSSYVELLIVFEEMGRRLLCSPYFSSVAMATNLLLRSSDEPAMQTYLPGIATGATLATVALVEESGRWDADGVRLTATPDGDGWRLTGIKDYVVDGGTADLVLVVARTSAGVTTFAVDGAAEGITRSSVPTMDETRRLARLEFDQCRASLVGEDGAGWVAVEAMLDRAAIALAAEEVGGAQRVLEMAVEYAKLRVQFGRAIGSFQAVKHKCADMLVEVESARSAAYYAAWGAAAGDPELPVLACIAKAFCSEAYFRVAAENIQVHGGIGFTWEHPAHLYYRRAKSSEFLLGDPSYHRELLVQRIGV